MSGFSSGLALVFSGLIYSMSVLAAPADTDFTNGVTAFRAGNYQQAISSFEKARQAGNHSSALYYNLGASYYKTQQYARSEQAFKRLLADKKFRQLAQYNLGLIKLKQGDRASASGWFEQAINTDSSPKLTALAEHMLESTRSRAGGQQASGLLNLALGHDSNVTLASTGSPTQQSDSYTELFGFVSLPAGPLILNASLFRLDYASVNSADFMQLRAGIQYPFNAMGWTWRPGVFYARDTLAGNDFLTLSDIELKGRKLLQSGRLDLRLRYSDIQADNAVYNYLQGNRQQFRVDYLRATTLGYMRLRYELELNDRQNMPTANYSPTRNNVQLRLQQIMGQQWHTSEELSWRNSHYGEAAGVVRDDTRYELSLKAYRQFARAWRAGMSYRYSDNRSNLAAETYTRNDVQVYLSRNF